MLEHNDFKESLLAEINELQKQKAQLIQSLKQAPEGSLNVLEKAGKKPQYYWYQGRKKRHYLSQKQRSVAECLAQKGYDQQVLEIIESRLQRASYLLQGYEKSIEKIYEEMPLPRQSLVTPLILSDEEYIKAWYEKHPGGQNSYPLNGEYYSNRGEQMRSKSEKILADMFERYHIPYVYEPKLVLGIGKTIYPDFLLLHVRLRKTIVFEHFGMMNDPGYSEKACAKLLLYAQNGYLPGDKLLFSMESQSDPLSTRVVENIITSSFNKL